MADTGNWAYETDGVVVGSGAGALTAAVRARDLGLEVLVIEKTEQYGGSSAMSGGVLWLPNSPLVAGAGGADSPEEGKRYLKSVVDEPHLEKRIDAYVEQIPGFIDFLHRSTHLRLAPLPQFPDMYPDNPDAKMHRCHEALPFHARTLPADEVLNLRPQHPQTALFGLIGWTPSESLILQARGKGWLTVAFTMVARYLLDIPWRLRSRRDRRLVLGGALVGALRRSMLDRGIPLWLNSPFEDFIEQDGRVAGVLARHDGVRARIRARKGVILAAGGFEKNNAMRRKHLPQPSDAAWTAGAPGNTGEMIEAGERIGAATRFMDAAWWGPTFLIPGEEQARMLIIEKNLPGSIIVNRAGERFVNESSSYTKVTRGIYSANVPGRESVPAALVFDASYRRHYPFGPMLPSTFQPDFAVPPGAWRGIAKADTIEDLARQLDVDPAGLAETVRKFNGYAASGKDADFQRGDANYDRYYGDQSVGPNPCLGPIAKPPFYGTKVYPGELGTKGGLDTDEHARVLDGQGRVIAGLYAIGNCSAAVTGQTYPASGSTLAPAMVFAFRAADDATRQ